MIGSGNFRHSNCLTILKLKLTTNCQLTFIEISFFRFTIIIGVYRNGHLLIVSNRRSNLMAGRITFCTIFIFDLKETPIHFSRYFSFFAAPETRNAEHDLERLLSLSRTASSVSFADLLLPSGKQCPLFCFAFVPTTILNVLQ